MQAQQKDEGNGNDANRNMLNFHYVSSFLGILFF